MRVSDFKKLLCERHVQDIIGMHTHEKITLTEKQIDKCIEKKNSKDCPKRKTQRERVLEYIKRFGSITSLQAYKDLGVTRLSAVIFELKASGYNITSSTISSKNRYGELCHYSKYTLKK